MTTNFIGRANELRTLNDFFNKNSASLIVIQGRRRIGKSRLIEEFGKNHTFFRFSGISPTNTTTAQSQRDEFSHQMQIETNLPEIFADDWTKLFILLYEKIKHGKIIVVFDEISWIGSKDPDFLGKLKYAWDLYFKKNPQLILILCGSASVWIEKNILSSTGFMGRLSFRMTLEELSIRECNQFWKKTKYISGYEKLKVLAVTGGVPRYLEEINPKISAEENIKRLCFVKGGILVNEFNDIFNDLFNKRSHTYKKIVLALSDGPLAIKELCAKLSIKQTGFISEYLDDLIKSGFISRDNTWHLKSSEISRLSHFRLSDNYLRFYLKYIDPKLNKINNNDFTFKSLSLLSNFDTIMGFQFENLILKNRHYIKQCLRLTDDEIISDNPFFQRTTNRTRGCQIDYLIQTRFNTLYICEIKFAQNPLGTNIISEVQAKIDALSYPRKFSCRPVLIHVNGVTNDVINSNFFAHIIDITQLLAE